MEAYLDNSATTQPCKEAVDKMNYALKTCWGNPSSLHAKGIAASELIEDSRRNIAKALSCESSEIYFTSGGTESNNIAVFGAAAAAIPDCKQSLKYATELRDYMVSRLRAIDGVRINSPENALPYITNISVEGIPSEVMLNYLSGMGIYISSGSACSKGHKSRVLKAMNLSEDVISTALRISTSVFTTKEEIDMLIGGILSARQTMRRMK